MQIVKPGTPVITINGSVKAIITGVCIRNESISYEISYFGGMQHRTTWIYRYEFEVDASTKTQAGFKSYDTTEQEQNLISVQSVLDN